MKLFVTGATGNVGKEVLSALSLIQHDLDIYAGMREVKESEKHNFKESTPITFDFTDPSGFNHALQDCDILFLLRPPQISDVTLYFKPLIEACKASEVKHIIFLSVQGVEKSTIIPHFKIEKLIVESGIPYTFLRPAYFMQNFTITLKKDIISSNLIYLPAGKAKFTIVDVRDVGLVAAKVATTTSMHINKSYELTNNEKYTFSEMAEILSAGLGRTIQFKSPNLIQFFLKKRKEDTPVMFIFVMIMLHYFPRFQQAPKCTEWVKVLTDREPTTFEQFITEHQKELSISQQFSS